MYCSEEVEGFPMETMGKDLRIFRAESECRALNGIVCT